MAKAGPATLQDRLSRIEGQVRGVSKMAESQEAPEKIMVQVSAIISSLESVKIEIIKSQMKKKLLEELDNVVNMLK